MLVAASFGTLEKKHPIMSAHYEQYKVLLKVKKKKTNKFKKACKEDYSLVIR